MKLFDWLLGPQKLSAPTKESNEIEIMPAESCNTKYSLYRNLAMKVMDYLYNQYRLNGGDVKSIKDILIDFYDLSNRLKENEPNCLNFIVYWSFIPGSSLTSIRDYVMFEPTWRIECCYGDALPKVIIKKVN